MIPFRLFSLLLVGLCIVLSGAAPLPNKDLSTTSLEKQDTTLSSLKSRSPNEMPIFISHRDLEDSRTLINRGFLDAFKKLGNRMKKGFQKMGGGIKNVAQTAASKIKNVAQKAVSGVKTGATIVKNYMQTNGAKLGKVALEGLSVGSSLASKAFKFIPGIGKPLSMALSGASKAADIGSNKINANLDGDWAKSMKVMKKVKNPLGGVGGEILDALRRDVDEALWERFEAENSSELFIGRDYD